MAGNGLNRFLGGSPAQVILRLAFLSFVVGIILSALDLYPHDLLIIAFEFIDRIWTLGFEAFGRIGSYFAIGAMVVVPIWLVTRIFALGRNKDG